MRYRWDSEQGRRNLKRHGIGFEDAVRIFDGPTMGRRLKRLMTGSITMRPESMRLAW